MARKPDVVVDGVVEVSVEDWPRCCAFGILTGWAAMKKDDITSKYPGSGYETVAAHTTDLTPAKNKLDYTGRKIWDQSVLCCVLTDGQVAANEATLKNGGFEALQRYRNPRTHEPVTLFVRVPKAVERLPITDAK